MKNSPPHICLVCSRLDLPGGTERASVNLANLLQANGHPVSIVIADETEALFYPLHPGIRVYLEKLSFGIGTKGNALTRKLQLWKDIRTLRKRFLQLRPDFIIGTEYHLSIANGLAAKKLPARLFAWEHHHLYWLRKNRFWDLLFRRVYPQLHKVVCQNSTEKGLFEAMGCPATVIPYSVPPAAAQAGLHTRQLLTIGWLIRRKGVDLIPRIAEKLKARHPQWRWLLIGEGEEKEALEAEITERKLGDFLQAVPPQSQDLEATYLDTSVYVMTSRFECLPMVLLESSSYGIPAVAFDCPTGPADIITSGKDGYLTPLEDVDAMASAILQLMDDAALREKMGHAARLSSERYAPQRVYRLWKELFESFR